MLLLWSCNDNLVQNNNCTETYKTLTRYIQLSPKMAVDSDNICWQTDVVV